MIKLVINNLRPSENHRFIFIAQKVHIESYSLLEKLSEWAPGCVVVGLDKLTEGAACTVLSAKHLIDNEDSLMIANSDQYIDVAIDDYLGHMTTADLDGQIMTMTADDPKWSFVALDDKRLVTRVVEKEVISNEATVGIYNFKHGSDFVSAAETMIEREERVNGEYYVAPAYNSMITAKKNIGIYNVGSEAKGMYGLGIPADLELFLSMSVSVAATKGL